MGDDDEIKQLIRKESESFLKRASSKLKEGKAPTTSRPSSRRPAGIDPTSCSAPQR